MKELPESVQCGINVLYFCCGISSLYISQLQHMTITEDKQCMWSMFLQSCLNISLLTRKGGSTIKPHSYNIADLKVSVFETLDKSCIYDLSICFFKGTTSKKHSTGVPFSYRWQNWQFFHSRDISTLISHDIKNDAFGSIFKQTLQLMFQVLW